MVTAMIVIEAMVAVVMTTVVVIVTLPEVTATLLAQLTTAVVDTETVMNVNLMAAPLVRPLRLAMETRLPVAKAESRTEVDHTTKKDTPVVKWLANMHRCGALFAINIRASARRRRFAAIQVRSTTPTITSSRIIYAGMG